MKRFLKCSGLILAVAMVMAASTASASLQVVGGPISGDSWGQQFQWISETGATGFNALEVWVSYSTPNNSVFLYNNTGITPAEPVLGSYNDASDPAPNSVPAWTLQTYANSSGTLSAAIAQGTSVLATSPGDALTKNLGFNLWLSGNSSDKVSIAIEEGTDPTNNYAGFAAVAAGSAYWNGTKWAITDYSTHEELATFAALYGGSGGITTPEPATLIIWSLLGSCVAGLAAWRRVAARRAK